MNNSNKEKPLSIRGGENFFWDADLIINMTVPTTEELEYSKKRKAESDIILSVGKSKHDGPLTIPIIKNKRKTESMKQVTITVEGASGTGKSNIAYAIAKALEAYNIKVQIEDEEYSSDLDAALNAISTKSEVTIIQKQAKRPIHTSL